MGFSFDDLTRKAKNMASIAADKAKDAADLTRLNVAIAGEQKELDKTYRTIGEWFVSEYEGEIPDAVRDMVEAVNTSKAKIAELEAQKTAVKEEGPDLEPEPAAPAQKTCHICGAVSDSRFCPQCGAPMSDE